MTERLDLPQLVRASASASGSLPGDYTALTARRLGIAAAATGAVHLAYVVLYRTIWAAAGHAMGMATGLVGLAVSTAVAAYLLVGQRPTERVALIGVGYEIVLSFVLACSESWSVRYDVPSPQVAWVGVLIVLFPYLIPAPPRMVVFSAIASATMVPLSIALHFGLGDGPWPEPGVLASYVLPPFFCAFLAWAPISALHRLGTAVQQARRLGSYELVERLGHGGMGEVWRANHRLLARPAAVKLIKPEMLGAKDAASRAALIRRFEKEAQATATLDSVHTVELYDFGVSADGVLFYVMELLHGLDLQALVERHGALPSARVVYLLEQACDSLEEAHRRGLIHRDIKPANLFLTRKGERCDFLKVLDFGLVKRAHGDGEKTEAPLSELAATQSQQTGLGQVVGTPAFLAPEAALGEHAVDGRADIYALGCVAYWLLTGTVVFAADSAVAMALAHVTQEPEPLSRRSGLTIDPELERVVLSCLHKDRNRRPASARELQVQLSAVAARAAWTERDAAAWWEEHLAAVPAERTGRS